jgi:hypothetical protein
MDNLNERTLANMDTVLEETCHGFANGGDHELRRYIAEQLKLNAEKGSVTLIQLRAVAQRALREAVKEKTFRP